MGKWIKLPGVFTPKAEWESVNCEYDKALYDTVALGERSVGRWDVGEMLAPWGC